MALKTPPVPHLGVRGVGGDGLGGVGWEFREVGEVMSRVDCREVGEVMRVDCREVDEVMRMDCREVGE
jgi:hypothetical protein